MQAKAPKFVVYLRVSTQKQGRSGLGIEAQRAAVARLVAERGGRVIAPEFVEVETGKRNDRPKLGEALKKCRMTGATLAIAKLDRLSRNAAFLLTLRDSGVDFIAADLPHANALTVGVMALMAEEERAAISARTKGALAAAKLRGVKLGGHREGTPDILLHQSAGVAALRQHAQEWAEEWRELLGPLKREGLSCAAIARRLNEAGNVTRQGAPWSPTTVHRTLARLSL